MRIVPVRHLSRKGLIGQPVVDYVRSLPQDILAGGVPDAFHVTRGLAARHPRAGPP